MMALEIIDNRFGEYKKLLPDLLLLILTKEHPLTIGEITARLRNNFNVKISFQAVRKCLNNMLERKIINVEDKTYSINKNYVLELKRMTDQILKNYFQGSKKSKVVAWSEKPESYASYVFENFIKTDQFCNEIILDWAHNIKDEDDHTFCFQSPHYWYVFGQLGTESSFLTEIKALKVKAHYIADGHTLLDKWTKKFYDAHEVKYKINSSVTKMKTSIGVFGDFVVQYDYPNELYEEIGKFYKETKNLETLNITQIAVLLELKSKIIFTVMKNKAIAQKIKEELLSKFN